MTAPRKSKQQLAAEARARGLLRERDAIGLFAFERLQLKRRAARLERCRERTRLAMARRQGPRHAENSTLPFGESA